MSPTDGCSSISARGNASFCNDEDGVLCCAAFSIARWSRPLSAATGALHVQCGMSKSYGF
ncbi:hypothetical protein [Mumia zhuanghuii]|uniref:Uncharacterized protein n=1 Tax=Mumia zhuanghuii TaxID=2585211 RepID=A0A5C4LSY3_9ACTN|nr:hypothetical protein [Mumia zhuanghuii]TNC22168.1 hypothetical protein FHE65_35815 [Mumia zhuanghuii]